MSDISAVVLSLGEATTARAISSIRCQTVPAREILTVENVTPFHWHWALNRGASQVRTTYFCQVDADMVLDEDCFERLLGVMGPDIGIACGYLRDPLIGKVSSIRVFRRECFDTVRFEDSISPDTDFRDAIRDRGWQTVFALRYEGSPDLWHTFGSHLPVYSPEYTFRKHMFLGRRYLYRRDLSGFIWHLNAVKRSKHAASFVAEIALAHGAFGQDNRDLLGRAAFEQDFAVLEG